VALYDPQSRYVEARFEENKVAQLQLGQEAELTVDALPGLVLRGRIRRIAPAAAQEFALIPRDVTAGEFTKVVQRVPVELEILELQRHPEVVPGLSVVVAVKKNHGGVRGS
jgi:membrane fusion protein (multidrug efflux system)